MTSTEHSPCSTSNSTNTDTRGCVLVVDDNDKVRALLATGLRAAGHSVITAATQIELQRHLSTSTPAALIVDLQRSQSDGIRLISRMRARPDLLQTPILFLSGSEDDRFRFDVLAAGADYFGLRPFGVVELQNVLDGLLRQGRPSSSANLRPPTRLDRLERLKRVRRLRRTG